MRDARLTGPELPSHTRLAESEVELVDGEEDSGGGVGTVFHL